PRPVATTFALARPRRTSSARTTSARWFASASFTASVPTRSVCPTTITSATGRFAISANTASSCASDSAESSSLPSAKCSVYDISRRGCAASAAPKSRDTSSGVASYVRVSSALRLAAAYGWSRTTSPRLSATLTAVLRPSGSGRSTTFTVGAHPARAATAANTSAATRAGPAANMSAVDEHHELGAADSKDVRRRADLHRLGRLLGDLAGDDRQRALRQRRVELALV